MTSLAAICSSLGRIAPLELAESWDNVGLLVGDRAAQVNRVMTCLTVTPSVVDEAEAEQADLIVVHHPLPFKSLQRVTTDTIAGSMLLRLIRGGVAIYSAHTAFDSAADGINQMWADFFDLGSVTPLVETIDRCAGDDAKTESADVVQGAGRVGKLAQPITLELVARRAADSVAASAPRIIGDRAHSVGKIAFACGSGGSFLADARRCGCDALITGEATFHTCLEAEASQIGLVLLGHYFSERFAMERLADRLSDEFSELTVWASRRERDPISTL